MLNFFRPKPVHLNIQGLGEFRYFKDDIDEYWELVSGFHNSSDSINLKYCLISGDRAGIDHSSQVVTADLLQNTGKLWGLIDDRFVQIARKDIPGVSRETVRNHFYASSIAVESKDSFEVGFHAVALDIFIEIFLRYGSVTRIEKDYGCCEE